MNEATIIDRIVSILGPCMGEAMARASLKVYINEVKIKHGSFKPSHLPQVVDRLERALQAFVGSEKAGMLAQQILGLVRRKAAQA